jgi:adenine-specific DNA-methyltransferase
MGSVQFLGSITKKGQPSGNPLGKNPSDVWDIPNVKSNHIEKTGHPCQFPVGLIERLVLGLTHEGDLVVDPYIGVGSAAIASLKHGRRAAGADIYEEYLNITRDRIERLANGTLRTRPMNQPPYEPTGNESVARVPDEWLPIED